MKKEHNGCLLAIRVRGSAGLRHQIEATLKNIGLNRRNQAILLADNLSMRGTLRKIKDAILWGEATEEILVPLLRLRSRIRGSVRITDAEIKKKFDVENVKALAKLLSTGELRPQELKKKGVSTTFNLHSPKGGFRGSMKDPSGRGGVLGFRLEAFKEVVESMI